MFDVICSYIISISLLVSLYFYILMKKKFLLFIFSTNKLILFLNEFNTFDISVFDSLKSLISFN